MFESKISKELHRQVFELTLALYRVTDFFPQGEVLRRQLREKANEIFGGISEYGYSREYPQEAVAILAKIQAVNGYLAVARAMRFVKPINLTVLEREYNFLTDFLSKELEVNSNNSAAEITPSVTVEEKKPQVQEPLTTRDELAVDKPGLIHVATDFNQRQKKILEHLSTVQQAKVSDFYGFFEGISSKTVQRDLQELVTKSILKKDGEKRWTTYLLNNVP